MTRLFVRVALLAGGIAVLALLCLRFGLDDLVAAFGRVTPAAFLGYLCCACAVRLGLSLRWRAVAHTLGECPPLAQLVVARLAGDAVGAVLPAGRVSGDPLRAALVYGEGLGGTQASAGVAVDRIMEVIGNSLCAITYVTVFSFMHAFGGTQRAATIVVSTMCLLLAFLAVALLMLRRGVSPLEPFYVLAGRLSASRCNAWIGALRLTEGHLTRFFRDHPASFRRGLLASLCIEGLQIGEYYFLLATFGLTIDLATILLMMVASGMARAVPAPAGLGALEASQVAVLTVAGGRPEIGFVAGMVLRLHESLWIAAGLVALSLQGFSLTRLRLLLAGGQAVA